MLAPKCSARKAGSGTVPSLWISLACAATTVRPGMASSHPSGSSAEAGSLKRCGLRPGTMKTKLENSPWRSHFRRTAPSWALNCATPGPGGDTSWRAHRRATC